MRADAVHLMTGGAFRVDEPGPPALTIAERDIGGIEVTHIAHEGDDTGNFRRVQAPSRHRGAGNTLGDDAPEIVVGCRVAKATASKINACDLITSGSVALCAQRR